MRTQRLYPGVLRLSGLLLAAALICLSGCKPDEEYNESGGSPAAGAQAAPQAVNVSVAAAVERLRSGDFGGARADRKSVV